MKLINTYIVEKLHINKNIKILHNINELNDALIDHFGEKDSSFSFLKKDCEIHIFCMTDEEKNKVHEIFPKIILNVAEINKFKSTMVDDYCINIFDLVMEYKKAKKNLDDLYSDLVKSFEKFYRI